MIAQRIDVRIAMAPEAREVPVSGVNAASILVTPRGQLRATRQLVVARPLLTGTPATVRLRVPRVKVKVTRPDAEALESVTT